MISKERRAKPSAMPSAFIIRRSTDAAARVSRDAIYDRLNSLLAASVAMPCRSEPRFLPSPPRASYRVAYAASTAPAPPLLDERLRSIY